MADTLLQEIDQALRADRAGALWARWRGPLLVVAAALILGTAAHSGWKAYREAKGGGLLLELSDAQKLLVNEKPAEAAKMFGEIAGRASGEFKSLALVWQSRASTKAGQKDEAIAALKTAASNGHSLWTDIACLRLAGLDEAAAQGCLNASANSPLAATRAQWAIANLWAKGDVAGAKAALEKIIADKNTSADDKARMTQWLSVMNGAKS